MIGAIAGSARRMARLESVLTSLLMMAVSAVTQAQTTVFINELHYDNSGSDTGEAVEIAGPAGADLTGADLAGADLEGANLEGAKLEDANLGPG